MAGATEPMDGAVILDGLYEFLRGSCGFSLIVGGISLVLAPSRDRVLSRLGILFSAVGFLFCLSALDPLLRIPEDPSNLLIAAAILALSQALFEIAAYLFEVHAARRAERWILAIGIAWSAAVVGLPLLDYPLGLGAVARSVEDQASLGPIHAAAALAIYAWPIAIAFFAAWTSRASLRGLPTGSPGTRVLARGTALLVAILLAVLAGAALDSVTLYRAGHLALELFMLAWFLLIAARPELFSRTRREIHDARERNAQALGEAEAQAIGAKIAKFSASPELLARAGLDLRSLAAHIRVPPYRLSIYFNACLKTSFPAWLNALRIEAVRRRILEEPERSILHLALDAGFGSKSAFNAHFSRIVGMSPSEYRHANRSKTTS